MSGRRLVPGNLCACGCGEKVRYEYLRGHRPRRDLHASVETSESGCWIWTGRLNADGYGVAKRDRKTVTVHLLMWTDAIGPVPQGMELDHLCRNRACCNPNHLEPVPHRENVLRGISPAAFHARKTHCKNGHPFNDQNTRRYPGRRVCKTCEAAAQRRCKARNRSVA